MHPLLGTLSNLTDDELHSKLNELNKRFTQAYRYGGSHMMPHVKASFDYLYPRMSKNGVYMVEDMHTAYWEEYGGGLKSQASFVERFKDFIDDINVRFIRDNNGSVQGLDGAYCLSIYESILVIERSSFINGKMTLLGDSQRRVNLNAS